MEKNGEHTNKVLLTKAVLEFYRQRPNKHFHVTKYVLGKIKIDGRPLSRGEMGCAVRHAIECGCMRRVSNSRIEIISYDLTREK